MKFSELPIKTQERLKDESRKRFRNDAYEVYLVSRNGSRYLMARRHQIPWSDCNGNSMPFGGGSEWSVQYGELAFALRRQVIGRDYEICHGKRFGKSANGTIIPKSVKTKKEVMALAKAIGIFEL